MAKKQKPCDECGDRTPDVMRVADPFAAEVNDEVWMRDLCAGCYTARLDEA